MHTLNSGFTQISERPKPLPRKTELIMPMIDKGYGDFPGTNLRCKFLLTSEGGPGSRSGAAFYEIHVRERRSSTQVVTACVCWNQTLSAWAWEMTRRGYEVLRNKPRNRGWSLADVPDMPLQPWMASMLLPEIQLLSMGDLQPLGQITRALAWALIVHGERQPGPTVH